MVSAATGEFLAGPEADAGYWYESLRAPVEFARAVGVLAGQGHRVFVEVSPHPVLTAAVTGTLEEAGLDGVVAGTLRREDGGPGRFLASLAEAFAGGVPVNWAAVLGGERVDLPTYAFARQRFWPRPAGVPAAGAVLLGLGAAGHPLLGAAVELAAGGGLVLTGRLSLTAQPWLADHVVAGTVLVPGTALVELAIRAGDQAGCGRLAELALEAPLVLDGRAAMQLQVTVGGADDRGQRAVEIHARPEDAAGEGGWTRHASGLAGPGRPRRSGGAGDVAAAGCDAGAGGGSLPGPGGGGLRVRAGVPRAAGGVGAGGGGLRGGGAAGGGGR